MQATQDSNNTSADISSKRVYYSSSKWKTCELECMHALNMNILECLNQIYSGLPSSIEAEVLRKMLFRFTCTTTVFKKLYNKVPVPNKVFQLEKNALQQLLFDDQLDSKVWY